MVRFLRHVGKNHLGSKVIIVFREIPDDPEHCLVVESQTLPDMYHDNIMRTLESSSAQETVDLYEVLARSRFGDGQIMLNALHNRGLLKKCKVDQISVVPMPNRSAPLSEVNKQIREGKGEEALPTESASEVSEVVENPVIVDTQPTQEQPTEGSEEQQKSLAESKLLQARLMEDDAQRLRKEAYDLDPDLKKGGRPSKKQVKKVAKAKSKDDTKAKAGE